MSRRFVLFGGPADGQRGTIITPPDWIRYNGNQGGSPWAQHPAYDAPDARMYLRTDEVDSTGAMIYRVQPHGAGSTDEGEQAAQG